MSTPQRRLRRIIGTSGLAFLIAAAVAVTVERRPAAASVDSPPAASAINTRPNIVILLSDDQPAGFMQMAKLKADIGAHGVTFSNAFVEDPLCCPSRTSILRGQDAHTTGIYTNASPEGGFKGVRARHLDEASTGGMLGLWLHDAGYRTGMVGKYLNGYPVQGYVPPGWDYWRALTKIDPDGYRKYGVASWQAGQATTTQLPAQGYSTDAVNRYAHRFITTTPAADPLFLYLAWRAPHLPAIPSAKYDTNAEAPMCKGVKTTAKPSFDEPDVSDKPKYIRQRFPFDTATAELYGVTYPQKVCRSLLSVDDGVHQVIQDLAATGRLSNTLIFYLSDNGMLFGEHRWLQKKVPYEESIHVPFLMRYDPLTSGALAGTTSSAFVMNVDLAPTIADLVGFTGRPDGGFDGLDLMPLLRGTATSVRSDFLVEHSESPGAPDQVPDYCAVHGQRYIFIRYTATAGSPREEMYDLPSDPYELVNVAANPAYTKPHDRLSARLTALCMPLPPRYVP
jgi:N-acetylglucosamine-6-sulfatase